MKWGVWGDIVTGPFVNFGIRVPEGREGMLEKRDTRFVYSCGEVMEVNVGAIVKGLDADLEVVEEAKIVEIIDEAPLPIVLESKKQPLDGASISLLSPDPEDTFKKGKAGGKYEGFFDLIYIGAMFAPRIKGIL